ncbi:urease accessory protein UreF [Chitinophagaceae bacterium LB-8]|uniref:Urease accessory protein UreF n=1 Tax=Paraflavisolibacter caeni TaxID=2982496 RepID=A0A9X2XNU0_9BACT|nr:urease accessory protein UreF [Paraflavisolibacter caeni]MCU7549628.1 urease accessory protein UreF [Paraflavisolibacter caeni]
MSNTNLVRLLQLTDPTLPVGGFSHSYGLETYVQKQLVHDAASAKDFVLQMLTQNIHFTDAAFVSLAYDSIAHKNIEQVLELDEECNAVKLPRELREASLKMGMRLLKIFSPMHNDVILQQFRKETTSRKAFGHYCIVFGLLAFIFNIPKQDALAGFYYNAATGMVTNCVKLVPLGQQQGQEILFSFQSVIHDLAQKSMNPDRDLLGLCCNGFDIRSMQHEQLYTRLYMS